MPIKVLRDVDGLGELPKIEILKAGTYDSFLNLILE
jgi:hypothetical protein